MDELDKAITTAMENAISKNKVFRLERNLQRVSETWWNSGLDYWNDNIVSSKTVWNPTGLGGRFSMEEALLAFAIITNHHHISGIEAHIESLLFEFVVRTVRVPGHVNELLFTTDNFKSLQPKPKFEGYAPVNLAAVVCQSRNSEITDDRLQKIIKESSPNISEDDVERCLRHCRSLQGCRFGIPNAWESICKSLSEFHKDIEIAFLGFVGLTMLRTHL